MSHQYNAVYYCPSQYSSLEEATKVRGVSHWCSTYGYSSTMDSMVNIAGALSRVDPELMKDLRFVWTIDGVTFPEMNMADSYVLLDQSANEFRDHQNVLSTGKKS
jgi:hypothetical protein